MSWKYFRSSDICWKLCLLFCRFKPFVDVTKIVQSMRNTLILLLTAYKWGLIFMSMDLLYLSGIFCMLALWSNIKHVCNYETFRFWLQFCISISLSNVRPFKWFKNQLECIVQLQFLLGFRAAYIMQALKLGISFFLILAINSVAGLGPKPKPRTKRFSIFQVVEFPVSTVKCRNIARALIPETGFWVRNFEFIFRFFS